jgi:anti-sigma B factor antagonist
MRTYSRGDTLLVTGFTNLGGDNAFLLREFAHAALKEEHRFVEIDLAGTEYVDSEGLGALISVQRRLGSRQGRVRLIHVKPMVAQFFELLHLDAVFDLAPS